MDNSKHWLTWGGAFVAWFNDFFNATISLMDNHAGAIGSVCAIIGVAIQLHGWWQKRKQQ